MFEWLNCMAYVFKSAVLFFKFAFFKASWYLLNIGDTARARYLHFLKTRFVKSYFSIIKSIIYILKKFKNCFDLWWTAFKFTALKC